MNLDIKGENGHYRHVNYITSIYVTSHGLGSLGRVAHDWS